MIVRTEIIAGSRLVVTKKGAGASRRHQQTHLIAISLGDGSEKKFKRASELSVPLDNLSSTASSTVFHRALMSSKDVQLPEGCRSNFPASLCAQSASLGSNGLSPVKTHS